MAFLQSLLKPDTDRLKARATFHGQMEQLFSLDDIRQICFDLDVTFDALPGQALGEKCRELYLYIERRGDLHRLVDACQHERPAANWTVT